MRLPRAEEPRCWSPQRGTSPAVECPCCRVGCVSSCRLDPLSCQSEDSRVKANVHPVRGPDVDVEAHPIVFDDKGDDSLTMKKTRRAADSEDRLHGDQGE